jgi:hypothetical protein
MDVLLCLLFSLAHTHTHALSLSLPFNHTFIYPLITLFFLLTTCVSSHLWVPSYVSNLYSPSPYHPSFLTLYSTPSTSFLCYLYLFAFFFYLLTYTWNTVNTLVVVEPSYMFEKGLFLYPLVVILHTPSFYI